jgi:hypothetical protein
MSPGRLAYEIGLLSETELADCLGTDIVTARAIYQGCRAIDLDDARAIFDLAMADARNR